MEADLSPDQQQGLQLVEELCSASGLELSAVLHGAEGHYLFVELQGPGAEPWGRLTGALDALQLLLNTALTRRVGSDVRLMLDAGGYRDRRASALTRRALELAAEVKKRNEEAELEPLPAHERRIIHTALADDPEVQTYSEGDEPARHVVIAPRA